LYYKTLSRNYIFIHKEIHNNEINDEVLIYDTDVRAI